VPEFVGVVPYIQTGGVSVVKPRSGIRIKPTAQAVGTKS